MLKEIWPSLDVQNRWAKPLFSAQYEEILNGIGFNWKKSQDETRWLLEQRWNHIGMHIRVDDFTDHEALVEKDDNKQYIFSSSLSLLPELEVAPARKRTR